MKYTIPISDMTWSYSRLKSFSDCKYAWFLKYLSVEPTDSLFFAEYGTFMHIILQKYFNKELDGDDLLDYYYANFSTMIKHSAPNQKILQKYFDDGEKFLDRFSSSSTTYGEKSYSLPEVTILGVEKELSFSVGDYKFIGFLDLLVKTDDGSLVIVDHKSRTLKERSKRKKPTKTDIELDEYLKQLYLYSKSVKEEYGEFPKYLVFNTFRDNTFIVEKFNVDKYTETIQWVLDTIHGIENESDWTPTIQCFHCNYICDVHDYCEYFELTRGVT